ncbi:MAG: hypothetical protein GY950_22315, partial [bacterium]|nr:hypothetical protein [bacterium]
MKEVLDLFKKSDDYKPPGTYEEALNRQCKVLALPTLFVMIFSWLPYIELDQNIFPHLPELLYFRMGLSAVSFISIILFFVPFFRGRSYHLLLFAVVYMELSTGLVLGLVAANPVYMGGFSFLVLVVSIIPLQRTHALTTLG